MKIRALTSSLLLLTICSYTTSADANPFVDSVIINNFVFDSSGSPWLDGWSLQASSGDTAHFVRDVPPASAAQWSLQLAAGSPEAIGSGESVRREFTGLTSGSYRATLWAKSSKFGVGGLINLYSTGVPWQYSTVNVKDTTWDSFSLTENFSLTPSDTLILELNGGDSEIANWRTYFNNITLEQLSSTSGVSKLAPDNPEIQIYPNPFSQSTQITFTPEASGYAEVSIFNQLGLEVARLFSGELDAGQQNTFEWTNPALPDGAYECMIRMNSQVQTLPMVLMR